MLTWETTVEAQALYARGWTKSAIARHLGINRRTVREYLKGQQVPGQRVRSEPEVFAPFAEYARLRLADDPHLWASTLFDELTALGYAGSYPSFTRALRTRKLRPHCEPCAASRGRDAGLIAHLPGAETGYSSNDPLAWAPDCSRGPRPLCAARVAATCRPTRPGGGRGRGLLGTRPESLAGLNLVTGAGARAGVRCAAIRASDGARAVGAVAVLSCVAGSLDRYRCGCPHTADCHGAADAAADAAHRGRLGQLHGGPID